MGSDVPSMLPQRKQSPSSAASKLFWSWCSVPQLLAFAILVCFFAGFSFAAWEPVASPPCKQDNLPPSVAPFDNAGGLMREAACALTCRPFASLERPWAVHYPNNTDYETYSGAALVPDGAMRRAFMSPYRISSKAGDGELQVCECSVQSSRGEAGASLERLLACLPHHLTSD